MRNDVFDTQRHLGAAPDAAQYGMAALAVLQGLDKPEDKSDDCDSLSIMAVNPERRRVLKPSECARLLGVCVKTLRSYVADGLPCHRLSARERRFFEDEVLAWLARRDSDGKERPCRS